MPLPFLRGMRPGIHVAIGPLLSLAVAIVVADPARSQNIVQYSGSLMIGFGDSDNYTLPVPDRANNAIPVCAIDGTNLFAPQTFGSLPVFGHATQMGTGPGATLMFAGHGYPFSPQQVPSLKGGAERRIAATCRATRQPFVPQRVRSSVKTASEIFPGTRAPWNGTTMTPAPTVAPQWTVGPGRGFAFSGMTLLTPIPAHQGSGAVSIRKGPNNFGGAIQYQGGGGVQLGINTYGTLGQPRPTDFGQANYFNGFLPMGPMPIGTDATGVDAPTPATRFPNGLLAGRVGTMAFRTPGPMGTVNQHGQIIHTPMGLPIITPVRYVGAFFEWTTGVARHSDMVGSFNTNRSAMGFDSSVVDGPSGTTRRLQLVSPFSAAIKLNGPFGLPMQRLDFGGVAVLDLKIAPVPEASLVSTLAVGVLGMLGLASGRRRKRGPTARCNSRA